MARKPKTEIAEAPAPAVIKTVKGFERGLVCRGHKFEVGETYSVEGPVTICRNGWHACENPLDVFSYYTPGTSVFHEVEQSGELARHGDDTKIASAIITIGVEISLHEMTIRAVEWIKSKIDWSNAPATNTGYQSAATNTGYRSAATNTGYQSAATNTGYQSAAEVSGKNSVAIATGYASKAKASEGGAICLVCRDDEGSIVAIRASKVGGNNVKPDVWYSLNSDGEFIENME